MHFRIWLPAEQPCANADPAPLRNVGLGHLAHGFHTVVHQIEGKSGVLYYWPQPGDPTALPKSPLKWESALPFRTLAAGRYSVGYDPEKLPKARELQVPLPIPGDHLPLNDAEQSWIIPDVLLLPVATVLTVDGVKLERMSRYQTRNFEATSWIKRCEAFTRQITTGKAEDGVEWGHAFEFGYDSLALNYRITPEIVNVLGLLTSETLGPMILAAVGSIELHRKQKFAAEALAIPLESEVDDGG